MGFIYTPVTIRNPADSSKAIEITFLVDTGAIDSLVPSDLLDSIDITPKGGREYVMADGSEVMLDISTADMEIMGELIGSTVVFGEPGTEPLLGAIDLQHAGIVVDPGKETLQKLPSMRRL